MLQPGSVFLGQVKKLDAISELRMVGYDQRFRWQSRIFDPEDEIQLGSRWQREAHLNVASKKTEIGSFGVAGNGYAFGFEFNGNRNLSTGMSSSLLLHRLMRLLGHGLVSFPNQDASTCNGASYRPERKDRSAINSNLGVNCLCSRFWIAERLKR